MTIRLVRYHTSRVDSAFRCALVKDGGRKWLQVLAIDASAKGGLKVWKVPLADEKDMVPLLLKGKPYPMARALRTFRRFAATHGCSKGAKKLLKEAADENKTNKKLGRESTAASPGDNA